MNFTDLEYAILDVLADPQKEFWTQQQLRSELRSREVDLPSESTLYDIVNRLLGFVSFNPVGTTKHRSFSNLHLTNAGRDKVAELRSGR